MLSFERWKGKIALVTGASTGIGATLAVALCDQGMRVVGVARRIELIEALRSKIKGTGELHAIRADISKEADIEDLFKQVKLKFGTVNVLINSAGLYRPGSVIEQNFSSIKHVMDVNILGLTYCTKLAINLMKDTGVDNGHIININSICGHAVLNQVFKMFNGVYSPSKFALTALTELLRQELVFSKSQIRVTSLSPGNVATDMVKVGVEDIGMEYDPSEMARLPHLLPEDIADAVVYILSTPPRVQIHELTIKPIGEPY